MATYLAGLVTCDVCYEIFKDPKSLVCRHTFCSECVAKIQRRNQVECPICKRQSQSRHIEPDFRTSSLVESYIAHKRAVKENCQGKLQNIKFGQKRKFCEICSSEEHQIICKCKECNQLMCKECKDMHEETALNDHHNVNTVVSLATDVKICLSKLKEQIEAKTSLNSKNQELINSSLSDCNSTKTNILQLIDKKEASLHEAIYKHHGNLRMKLHNQNELMRSNGKMFLVETNYRALALKNKLSMVSDLAEDTDDITLADIGEELTAKIQGELRDDAAIPEGLQLKDTIEVLDGEAFDETKSTTMLITSSFLPSNHEEHKQIFTLIDYSMIVNYDYKLEKVVAVPNNGRIASMFLTESELYCISSNCIHIYSNLLELKNSITLEFVTDVRSVAQINQEYFVTACAETGLHIHNKEGALLQRISVGSFSSVYILNGKIHAFSGSSKELVVYTQTTNTWEKSKTIRCLPDSYYFDPNWKLVISFPETLYLSTSQVNLIFQCDVDGKELNAFRRPGYLEITKKEIRMHICCSDSTGNVIVVNEDKDSLQMCTYSGAWSTMELRGKPDLRGPTFALPGHDGKCLWVSDKSGIKMYMPTKIPKLTLSST